MISFRCLIVGHSWYGRDGFAECRRCTPQPPSVAQDVPADPARLTGRSAAVLAALRGYIAIYGQAPTARELATATSLSPAGVRHQLRILAHHGRIRIDPSGARGIEIVDQEGTSQ